MDKPTREQCLDKTATRTNIEIILMKEKTEENFNRRFVFDLKNHVFCLKMRLVTSH